MTTNRQRRKRIAVTQGGISEADYIFFTWGDFFDAEGYREGKTEDQLRDFWKRHETAILARYMAEQERQKHPARRLWAWWKWSSPGPKLITGKRECYGPYPDFERRVMDIEEADEAYLRRHGLLETWEVALLEKTETKGMTNEQR